MKKQHIDSIKTMGLISLEVTYNAAIEIQAECELAGDNRIFFFISDFAQNYEIRTKGLNMLIALGAIKGMAKANNGNATYGYNLVIDIKKLSMIISRIKERMVVIAKETVQRQKANTEKVNIEKIKLVVRGKYDIIILNGREILKAETGGAPAELLKILFNNCNKHYQNTDYIITNTKFTSAPQVWDTIKEFRRRLNAGEIKKGVRKQGYILLLPT
jgi:hypothetical protein